MGNVLRWCHQTQALADDFLSYLRSYRRLRYYVESHVTSLNDVVRMMFSDDGTPPGRVEQWCIDHCRGRYQQVETDLWGFSDPGDADRFRMVWYRPDEPMPPPSRTLRVISGGLSGDD